MSLPPPERLRQILAAGIQAPSAENRHYLRLGIGPAAVVLTATDQASWPALPHRKWLALVAYGAVVENMRLRASQFGYAQNARWFPDPGRPERVAELAWTTTSAAPDPLAGAIELRHTNRRFYRRSPVEGNALERLAAALAAVPQAHLLWCEGRERKLALRALRLAETERFRRRGLHGELFSAVRFECGWRASSDEGLPPGALQVEPPMRAGFAALRRWPVMRAAGLVGAPYALGLRAAWLPCALAPHLGVLLLGGDGEVLDLQSGRALQRAWLAAAAAGLAFQPFAAPVALVRQRAGGAWVSPAVKSRLGQLLGELAAPYAGRVCMFFRVGHAAPAETVAGRLPLERYCVDAADDCNHS